MSVLFSRQCEYALQAVTYLALRPEGEKISIRELTRKIGIPYHFLGKILQSLTYKGLLVSQKGPTGGFGLARPAKDISLYDIVEAIDGTGFSTRCVMGFAECSGKNPCAVHTIWGDARQSLHATLADKNLSQIAREMKKPEYRS
ncbi:MAG TPA: Rrf2 family transcriptional regulator [Bacteroidota bacterium]|nr:Rrf2 family transcriptional regulator [Bacteroidota bacterium]